MTDWGLKIIIYLLVFSLKIHVNLWENNLSKK